MNALGVVTPEGSVQLLPERYEITVAGELERGNASPALASRLRQRWELTPAAEGLRWREEEALEERRAAPRLPAEHERTGERKELPPEVVRELERLKCFRGSQLGRALEGRAR